MAEEIEDQVIEQEVVEPVSARDEINNDVVRAISSLKAEAEPETIEAEEPVAERTRAADGKFAAKEPEAAKPAPEQKLPPTEDVAKANEQPSTVAAVPPVSWAADAKQAWASIPPAVQQAVLKREQEASNGIRQYSEKTARYEQALAPIAQEAAKLGMNVDDATKRLMDGHRFLEAQPEQAILWLAQKNGIDLANLASNPPAQQQARPDPAYAQVSQTVQTLEQRLQQIEFGNNLTVAQQFAASKPHYADVEDKLPDFIREVQKLDPSLTGAALLEAAYDRAVWLNHDVRAKVQNAEREAAAKTNLATVTAKASQARTAAVSVKGSSANAAPPRKPVNDGGSVYDDVRASLQQLRAG